METALMAGSFRLLRMLIPRTIFSIPDVTREDDELS